MLFTYHIINNIVLYKILLNFRYFIICNTNEMFCGISDV